MAIQTRFVAKAASTGGRNGHTATDDGVVSVGLSIPPAFGGVSRSGTTTPEHLFAAGYAACFGSAIEHVAAQQKTKIERLQVDAAVGIGPNESGGFSLNVALIVHLPTLPQEDAKSLVHAADQICPYSNAIRGNVDVSLQVAP